MSRIKKILIALDQLLAVIFVAKAMPDETFSSLCWRWELAGKRSWPRKLVDAIFFWDKNHCRESYEAERRGDQLPPELRPATGRPGQGGDSPDSRDGQDSGNGAVKFDGGKLRLDLIPPEITRALGDVLTHGAAKYGDRNWERGIANERLLAAMERHLLEWREGKTLDADSGLPHLAHALCNCGMLLTLEARNGRARKTEN